MDKTGTHASAAKLSQDGLSVTWREITSIVFVVAGFLCGRVIAFEYINPVIIAYLAAFLGTGASFYITCLAALVGLLSNVTKIALLEYLISIALLGMTNYFIIHNRITLSDSMKSAAGGMCILAGCVFSAVIDGIDAYFLLIGVIETIVTLSLTFIFIRAMDTITNFQKAPVLSNEQLVSVSILTGVCFVGIAEITFHSIYFRDVLSLFAVLLLANAGGAGVGATCGLIFAIIMFAGAKYSPAYTGILGVAGIAGGIFNDFGKGASTVCFILSALVATLYLDKSLITSALFFTFCAAGAAFLLLPRNVSEKISSALEPDITHEFEEYSAKTKEVATTRLKGFSESFRQLSKTFSSLSKKETCSSQKDVSALIDRIARQSCKNCERFDSCWKANFYVTYQAVFTMLSALEKTGAAAEIDIPESLKSQCISPRGFLEVMNRVLSLHNSDIKWHNRINESRELISQQLKGVSEIMDDFSCELETIMRFNYKYEVEIREQLEKQRIGVGSVIVLENKNGRYEVDLTTKSNIDIRSLRKSVVGTVGQILGRKMMRENMTVSENAGTKFKITEVRRFNVTTGVARVAKSGSAVSGDNYTWMELKNGRSIIALSDGMGSGTAANNESKATIEILEQFLESGFDKELAIKMINSILILKSDDDFFTTLDLLSIDLYTGACEIVKIGAVETFLLRGGSVRVIRQSGLPVGIVTGLEVETSAINLKDGDIILVVSDGVTEAGRPGKDFSWITETLEENKSLNPQYIADYIVERAKSLSPKIKDDMTALALRVWTK